MKSCEEYQEVVSAYVDNELEDEKSAELFLHLGKCAECRLFMLNTLALRSVFQESVIHEHQVKKISIHSVWKRKIFISYPISAMIATVMLVSSFFLFQKFTQKPLVVEKTTTEYVYLTPTVYATVNSSNEVKSN